MTIPRWRGFNLIDLFSTSVRWKEFFPISDGLISEEDFAMIRDLGFNFVRLPVSYLFVGKGAFGRVPDENRMWLIDRAIEFGQKHDVHVMLNVHRAPGFCVLAGSQFDFPEKDNLFTDDAPLVQYIDWWTMFAERYRDVPPSALSFDLLNEPFNIDDETYDRIFVPVIEAIHAISPERWIHAEGSFSAHGSFDANGAIDTVSLRPPTKTVVSMPNVISSFHLYHPLGLTRYNCPWSAVPDLEPPTWPYKPALLPGAEPRKLTGDEAKLWDKETMRELLAPYIEIVEAGHPVHVGEMGVWPGIDHDVYLAYTKDIVALLNEYGIGYALWTFRGPFGVMDNGFSDVHYEDFGSHQLDRKLADALLSD